MLSRAVQRGLGTDGIGLRLIPDRLQPGDTLFQPRLAQIGDTCLYCIAEALEAEVSLRGTLVQLGDVLPPPIGAFLATVQHGGKNLLQALGGQQAMLDVLATRLSNLSIDTLRRVQPVSPCRARIEAGPGSNMCSSDIGYPCRFAASWRPHMWHRTGSR